MGNKKKIDCIVHAEHILTMDKDLTVIHDGGVAVDKGKILAVGLYAGIAAEYESAVIVGGRARVIIPGLINTHTHAAMVSFRGLADDLPLKVWLEKHIWPAETRWLGPEFISDAIELACLEMLKAGVTTYSDMYFFGDSAGKATKRLGMRAVLGSGILDFPTAAAKTADEYLEKAEAFSLDWRGDELITTSIAPHALYTCSKETLKKAKALSEKLSLPMHIHLSETEWEVKEIISRHGKRPVEYLEDIGFLDDSVLAAHCVWVDDREIDLLAERRTGVSHCIESNLKLASGIAPVVRMLNSGVKVTFGTDGAASNNDLNIISEMSTAAKVHKAVSGDTTALDSRTALLMATRWGAEAIGLGSITGSLEPGKYADLVVINLDKPHLTPVYDIYSHITYSAMASDVETVIVNGRVVLNDRELKTGDEDSILRRARAWGEKIKNAD